MTSQPGISVNNKENNNRPTPKVLFWNGLVDGKPVATNSRNGKALTWHGPGNLVNTY
jgi:lipoate-protein ligase B